MKYFARAHIWVYRRTNGRIGAKLLWFPAALITTTGRKSGRPRTTPTLYLDDGDRVILPASFGGRDADPAWYLNLESNPEGARADSLPASRSEGQGCDRGRTKALLAQADQDVPAVSGISAGGGSGDSDGRLRAMTTFTAAATASRPAPMAIVTGLR